MVSRFIERYVDELKQAVDSLDKNAIERVIHKIYEAYKKNRQVFIMGNGGSASTASHFACDLGKGTIVEGCKRFRVISLNDNMAYITAFSNDYGYEHVFSEQLKNLVQRGDIVIAISASGNSQNIIHGIRYAKAKGAFVIGMVGFGGGKVRSLVDEAIYVDNENYGQIEDIHLVLSHLISQNIKEHIATAEQNLGKLREKISVGGGRGYGFQIQCLGDYTYM